MANSLPYCLSREIPEITLDEVATMIIQETTVEIAKRFPIEMEAIGTDKNHIHLLCSARPKVAPGRIVQIFKSITVHEIFRRKPAVKRVLWGVESFGPMGRATVKRCVNKFQAAILSG